MNLKRIICTAISGAMLLTAALSTAANAWSVYDTNYGSEEYESSKTAAAENAEILREKSDPNDDSSLLYTVLADGTAVITDYAGRFMEGNEYEFNIPSEINGHIVVAIGDKALTDGYAKITGIKLPPTIKEIGYNAIECRYLKYLNLNDGLEVIKNAAINCGDTLSTLVIPESVKYIGSNAISGKALKNITLPKSLEYLGKNILFGSAFSRDSANRENEILYNGQYLLAGLEIGYVNLDNPNPSAPTETKQIHEWEATGDIAIREGTTMMCEDAFGMSVITSVKLPSTLKAIPYLGFYRCENLNSVVIPGNVKNIGNNAFSWCENLSDITISEGVEKIGEMAFFRCNKLNEVTIPKSVTEIGLQAFGWDYVNNNDVRNENFVIKCYSKTAAEKYAKDNGFKCVLLDTGKTVEGGEPTSMADSRNTCEEKGDRCAVKRFIDIQSTDGDPNHRGIEFCLDNGIMTGTGANIFNPDSTITRAQFATMFYRLAGSHQANETSKFTDLTQDWYKKAVSWAAANGVINGTGSTTFSPDSTITREQIAAIFYRYAQTRGIDMSSSTDLSASDFRDKSEISAYALPAMNWCFDKSVMFEYVDQSHGYEILLAPQKAPSRAETATLFSKFSYVLNSN